ncbi:MAG: nuclear transport factor 2 family protein [Cyanobacteria bacterium J06632_22]
MFSLSVMRQPISPAAVEETVKKAAQAWRDENVEAFTSLFSMSGVMIAQQHRWVGKGNIRQAFTEFFSRNTDVKITIHQILIQENHAAVEWRWQERNRETGAVSNAEDAILIDFDSNGQILRWREYIDRTP